MRRPIGARRVDVKAGACVLNHQPNDRPVLRERRPARIDPTMPRNVRQRLLCDTKQRGLRPRVRTPGVGPDVAHDVDASPVSYLRGVPFQRGSQAILVKDGRAQIRHNLTDVLAEVLHRVETTVELRGEGIRIAGRLVRSGDFEPEPKPG